jgi:predicted permease
MCGILASCRSAETGLSVEGYASRREDPVLVVSNFVSPGYFTTVGMRLQSGRLLEEGDQRGAPGVAVVNQTFVRRYFTGKEPLGRRFGYKVMDQQIVGVVEDARLQNVKDEPEPMAFYPLQQRAVTPRTIEIRTAGDPRQVVDAVRRIILETAPGLPVEGVATLSERVSSNLSRERLLLSLTSAFGALALGLAGFGLFGLLSYAVARSTPDFGIRLALGASQASVLSAVVRDALRLAVAGIVIGLPLAIAGSRLMSALLFGVSSHDGATILTAVVVLVIVAGVAGLLPAWRASRVDPLVALRSE